MTIKDAVEDIKSHITFLEKHQGRSDLVLTTIEHSKSQEFATVFILGIDKVFKKRLYVAVSRAKQRLFILGDKQAFEKNELLARMPHNYYTELDRTGIQIGENESMTQSLHSPYQKPFLG
jgi:superfamily I DNA/RNA helicase